jgi:hypothetical protein
MVAILVIVIGAAAAALARTGGSAQVVTEWTPVPTMSAFPRLQPARIVVGTELVKA